MSINFYKTYDLNLKIETHETINLDLLKAHIPAIVEVQTHLDIDLSFIFEHGGTPEIIKDGKLTILKGISRADIPHLLYCLIRQYWIEKCYYPVHSICIDKSLFIGHSGCGKTTLGLKALERQLKVSSWNKTLLSNMTVVAGTDVINQRNNTLIPAPIIEYPTIENIYLFSLGNTFHIETIEPLSALHQLYPFFLDVIKEDVIISGEIVFSGMTSHKAKNHLINMLNEWLQSHKVYFISGSCDDIISYLEVNL